jgi:hypothetical protein
VSNHNLARTKQMLGKKVAKDSEKSTFPRAFRPRDQINFVTKEIAESGGLYSSRFQKIV